jgi:hypothetical protein
VRATAYGDVFIDNFWGEGQDSKMNPTTSTSFSGPTKRKTIQAERNPSLSVSYKIFMIQSISLDIEENNCCNISTSCTTKRSQPKGVGAPTR